MNYQNCPTTEFKLAHKCNFVGLPLGDWTEKALASHMVVSGCHRHRLLVGYLNASQVNMAFDDSKFANLLKEMDVLYADGQSIVWASRFLKQPIRGRVTAANFLLEFMRLVTDKGLTVAFIGGRPSIEAKLSEVDLAAESIRKEIPNVNIAYTHHGYLGQHDSWLRRKVLSDLTNADPHIVIVGMGAPLQEELVIKWGHSSKPRVWWCVGALFEYFSGTRTRSPLLLQNIGLEWSYRLLLEPRRLWKRYILGNPLFVYRIARNKMISFNRYGSK